MVEQKTGAPRRGGAIAVAAAGLTLAAGVTMGGLLGWVRPPETRAPATIEAPATTALEEPAPPQAPAIPAPSPVADPAEEPAIEPAVLALEHRDKHHDRHERREHGGRHERHGGDDGDDD